MHTSVSVSVQDGCDALDNEHAVADTSARHSEIPSTIDEILKDGVLVAANHDVLFYGLLGLHSCIVMLADPHQEIKFQIEIFRDYIRENVSSVTHRWYSIYGFLYSLDVLGIDISFQCLISLCS